MSKMNEIHLKDQKIRAYDFKGRDEYIEGIVLEKGTVFHPEYKVVMFEGYTIRITGALNSNDNRIGDIGFVPFATMMDWDGRIERVAKRPMNRDKKNLMVQIHITANEISERSKLTYCNEDKCSEGYHEDMMREELENLKALVAKYDRMVGTV